MREKFIEKIYSGWLAKIIGIRLGAPIEGWTYEKIKNIYGEIDGYLVDYHEFAADDDSNGPLFFIRALEDKKKGSKLQAQEVEDDNRPYLNGGIGLSVRQGSQLCCRKIVVTNGIDFKMVEKLNEK